MPERKFVVECEACRWERLFKTRDVANRKRQEHAASRSHMVKTTIVEPTTVYP